MHPHSAVCHYPLSLQVPLAFYIRPPTKLFDATSKEDFGSWAL